jgi:hypothetical protein
VLDDMETRGGPPLPRAAQGYGWIGVRTDTSARLKAEVQVAAGAEGRAPLLIVDGKVAAALFGHLQANVTARYERFHRLPRFIESRDAANAALGRYGTPASLVAKDGGAELVETNERATKDFASLAMRSSMPRSASA